MERSAELRGFVQHRGAPAAIEVTEELFEPLHILFFYPDPFYRLAALAAGGY